MCGVRELPPWLVGLLVATALALLAPPVHADDQPFVTIYTTDIQTAQGREFEQWLTWRINHGNERFNEFLSRSELEYGITDNLQGSLYLNYVFEQARPHIPLGPVETTNAFGVSGEVIWRLLNPYFDPIGFALYFEPSWSAKERSLETKLLFQKNFLNDTLRTVLNINFEDQWVENSIGHFDKESALEFDLGASYNVTPDLSVGLEFDNEHGFDDLILGGPARETSNSFFLGPTIYYVAHPWSIWWGAQAQLPIATNPTGTPRAVVSGQTVDAEHFRTTLKFAIDF